MRMQERDFTIAAYAFNRTSAAPEERFPAASLPSQQSFFDRFSGDRTGNSGGAQFQ